MSATEDLIRDNLDDLLLALSHDKEERKALKQQLAENRQQFEQLQQQCAEAMEWAHENALAAVAVREHAILLKGVKWERQRVLLLIAMELDRLEGEGTNALALKHLRENILQVASPCPDLGKAS